MSDTNDYRALDTSSESIQSPAQQFPANGGNNQAPIQEMERTSHNQEVIAVDAVFHHVTSIYPQEESFRSVLEQLVQVKTGFN